MLQTSLFVGFILIVVGGVGYQALIAPKLWMLKYGDGVYSPLRKAYKKAGSV